MGISTEQSRPSRRATRGRAPAAAAGGFEEELAEMWDEEEEEEQGPLLVFLGEFAEAPGDS